MKDSVNIYFVIAPLVVFGPLFLWVFYNLVGREMMRIPGDIRRQRERKAEAAEKFKKEHARKRGEGLTGAVHDANRTPLGFVMQAITYAWFAAVIGFFSASPPYAYTEPGTALIKVSISHPGKRKVECRKRTAEELRKLAANMRAASVCPRERWPVFVELKIDGKPVMAEKAEPKGLSNDGPSGFYRVFPVAAGERHIVARLRDKGEKGFDFERTETTDLKDRQVLAIRFDAEKGGFVIQ